MVRVVLIGCGGFARHYVGILHSMPERVDFRGIVDPYADRSPVCGDILRYGIPVYADFEAFYAADSADLAVISSPIQFHVPQTMFALEHGTNVLCEKPICPLEKDAIDLRDRAALLGKYLAVGFQWSFADPMQALKADIAAGKFGAPVRFTDLVSWPRSASYYTSSSFKGRINDASGVPVYDSIITNATAHYLHNMFFVAGSEAASLEYGLWRAYDIETFDTCVLRGEMKNGCAYYIGVTHAAPEQVDPKLEYRFEKGRVFFGFDGTDNLYAELDGVGLINYGSMGPERKILRTLDSIERGAPNLSPVDSVLPHLRLCERLFADIANVRDFPAEMKTVTPEYTYVNGIWDKIVQGCREDRLPQLTMRENSKHEA